MYDSIVEEYPCCAGYNNCDHKTVRLILSRWRMSLLSRLQQHQQQNYTIYYSWRIHSFVQFTITATTILKFYCWGTYVLCSLQQQQQQNKNSVAEEHMFCPVYNNSNNKTTILLLKSVIVVQDVHGAWENPRFRLPSGTSSWCWSLSLQTYLRTRRDKEQWQKITKTEKHWFITVVKHIDIAMVFCISLNQKNRNQSKSNQQFKVKWL